MGGIVHAVGLAKLLWSEVEVSESLCALSGTSVKGYNLGGGVGVVVIGFGGVFSTNSGSVNGSGQFHLGDRPKSIEKSSLLVA
jgi:hypothetical protein